MRKSLAKALRRRSVALKAALLKFNREAEALNRETLTFQQLLSYSFIADFTLLRESNEDVRSQPWAQPAVREAIILWLKLERTKEELIRVQVEAARVRSWIQQVNSTYVQFTNSLQASDHYLAMEFQRRHAAQVIHDQFNLKCLAKINQLAYTASRHQSLIGITLIHENMTDNHAAATNDAVDSGLAGDTGDIGGGTRGDTSNATRDEENDDDDVAGLEDGIEADEEDTNDLEKIVGFLHDEPDLHDYTVIAQQSDM